MCSQPREALAWSPNRWTEEEIRSSFANLFLTQQPTINSKLPPRTGNRYIIVGGSGFTGGWIVLHLLARGENPLNIRILDMRPPTRSDLCTGDARNVAFFRLDISKADAVERAFQAPWPIETEGEKPPPLTVIHTASNIRFYERTKSLLYRSETVNVQGTRNLLSSAKNANASYFVYTSSGSVSIRRSRYWIWPWQGRPNDFVQVINDDDSRAPELHEDFFSNYAYTKKVAETIVRGYDKTPTSGGRIRTGCIRPGNGVYGPGGDISVGAYLVRKVNPTWVQNSIQSECYVENVSLAHLLYERCLIDIEEHPGLSRPDTGGQAFVVTDPNPPITYGDIYLALTTLTKGETVFPKLPPVLMLLFAHSVEALYLGRIMAPSIPIVGNILARLIPEVGGDIVNLQPSLFPLTSVHLLFDDSKARLPPSEGGLGYDAPFTSLDGVCCVVYDYLRNRSKPEERQKSGGGIGFGFGLAKAQKGVKDLAEDYGLLRGGNDVKI